MSTNVSIESRTNGLRSSRVENFFHRINMRQCEEMGNNEPSIEEVRSFNEAVEARIKGRLRAAKANVEALFGEGRKELFHTKE